MPRATQALIAGALILGAGVMIFRSSRTYRVPEHAAPLVQPAASSSRPAPGSPTPSAAPSAAADVPSPTGSALPELPADAPKSVSFGVVLVTYTGAEASPADAPAKPAALARAKSLVVEARSSFDEAVKKGDRGSTAQAGTMPRGVLEPSIEYILFTLKKGEVYGEPVDTPRGYWVLKRND
jgi:hypothetical protein